MSVVNHRFGGCDGGTGAKSFVSFYICTTDLEKPVVGLVAGDLIFSIDTGQLYKATGPTTFLELATGSGSFVPLTRLVNTTSPLSGGGTLLADLTLAIADATTSGKGAVQLATDGQSAANVAVQGNDSRMSNARTPTAHAASHKLGGSDAIRLDEFALPTASVNFNGQQATSFRLENVTSDPASPTVGQCWLRTDL